MIELYTADQKDIPTNDRLVLIADRYLEFMHQPEIEAWVQGGGEVDIATEHQHAHIIERLARLGHHRFSEKFLQEIKTKLPVFERYNTSIQFFGKIQSNKLKHILKDCDVIESISTVKEAEQCLTLIQTLELEKKFYIQVNIGKEPQKNGVSVEALPYLAAHCLQIGLPISGLMCIPPRYDNPAPYFRKLRRLADDFKFRECQMGFSSDYRIAIAEGATSIRIASVLFHESL